MMNCQYRSNNDKSVQQLITTAATIIDKIKLNDKECMSYMK